MKAYVYNGHGGPEVEALADVPRPEPGPGQLLIAVDAAGVVERPGDGVTGFAPGIAVFGNSDAGGFSEFALLSAGVTAHKPAALSFTDAATLPVTDRIRATVTRLGGAPVARARTREVLDAVAQLVISGALNPYVTHTFPLDQAAEALRLVEDGHVRGKVVIEVTA